MFFKNMVLSLASCTAHKQKRPGARAVREFSKMVTSSHLVGDFRPRSIAAEDGSWCTAGLSSPLLRPAAAVAAAAEKDFDTFDRGRYTGVKTARPPFNPRGLEVDLFFFYFCIFWWGAQNPCVFFPLAHFFPHNVIHTLPLLFPPNYRTEGGVGGRGEHEL